MNKQMVRYTALLQAEQVPFAASTNMPVLMQYSKALTGQCVWAYKVWLPVGVHAALRGVSDKPLLAALDRTQHLGTAYRLMNMHTYLLPSE